MRALDISDGGLQLALLLKGTMTFIILGLATEHFFKCPGARAPVRMRVHHWAAIVFGTLHLGVIATSQDLSRVAMGAGFACYFTGLALFLWAQETVKGRPPALTFSDEPPEVLVTRGPFAFVRHPFYVSYSLVWWAGVVATGHPLVLASAIWMMVAYAIAARDEERAFEHGPWGDAYAAYKTRTGQWWPRVPVAVPWPQSRTRGAVAAALALLTMVMLLLGRSVLQQ
jgi:protein-S-isoprenylcysteine O-methyltransferase Ste14